MIVAGRARSAGGPKGARTLPAVSIVGAAPAVRRSSATCAARACSANVGAGTAQISSASATIAATGPSVIS